MIMIDKRLIVLVCLVAALAFALGCKGNNERVVPVAQPAGCAALGTPDARDQCYLGRVTTEGITDIKFCDKIVGSASKDNCYYQIFNKTKDTINCTTMTNLEVQDTCNMVVGIESAKPVSCYFIINLDKRDRCFFDMLSRWTWGDEINKDYCNMIYNGQTKADCIKMIKKYT